LVNKRFFGKAPFGFVSVTAQFSVSDSCIGPVFCTYAYSQSSGWSYAWKTSRSNLVE